MKKGKVLMKMTEESKTLQQIIDEWLLYCKINNFSKYTINHYKHQLHCFNLFCDFEQQVSVLTKQLFEEYILYCQKKGISNVTVVTYTKVIRTLFYWCMDKGYIISFKIKLPKFEKPLKETYTDEEVSKLLKKPNIRKSTFAEYRTWVMINYTLATGNRMNTIANLKIEDLDFDNKLIKLTTTKNKKAQMIPMVDDLKKVLIEYLTIRKGKLTDYLFCTANKLIVVITQVNTMNKYL